MITKRGKQRIDGLIQKRSVLPAELRQHFGADYTFHWIVAGEKSHANEKLCVAAAIVHGRK